MTVTTPPAAAPQGASAGGGFRKLRCSGCGKPVTEVNVIDGEVDVAVIDGKDPGGEWLAVRAAGGWEMWRRPGAGVRYRQHRCPGSGHTAVSQGAPHLLRTELGAEPITEAAPPPRRFTAADASAGILTPLPTTEGPCARRCGRTVPHRYGPNPVTVCDACRSNRR